MSVLGTAELDCSVLEEDWQTGQSFSAHWHSASLVPQKHHRPTVVEVQCSAGKQGLFRQWEARRLLQRYLSGAISQEGPLKSKARRPGGPAQPASTSAAQTGPRGLQQASTHIQEGVRCGTVPRRAVVGAAGPGREAKRNVELTTKKIPRTLGRVITLEIHRG